MSKVLYNIRLDQDIIDGIELIAKDKNRNKSELIRRILENYIENYKFYNK